MNTHDRTIIGIAGGLGPYAHIEFERLLLEATGHRMDRLPVDQDYPEWVVSCVPRTPDRTLALLDEGPSPLPDLVRSVERLAKAGAAFAIIPCNTAHAFIEAIRERTSIPIVDMLDLTVQEATASGEDAGAIGLLATTGTCRTRIYHDRVERMPGGRLLSVLDLPDGEELQRRLVMTPIYGPFVDGRHIGGGIKSGTVTPAVTAALGEAVERLVEAGAGRVICGCTEIPIGLGRGSWKGTPLIDPMEVAARAAVAFAFGDAPPPC